MVPVLGGTMFEIGFVVMMKDVLQRLGGGDAIAALLSRAGVVMLNFLVMFGLTFALGMRLFGELVFLWGQALVVSTLISCGGPLLLLRNLSDGRGLKLRQAIWLVFILPCGLCVLLLGAGLALQLGPAFQSVVVAAFFINLLCCLASVMRAFGSVQVSMTLRDAGPFVALGIAGISQAGANATAILSSACLAMGTMACASLVWTYLYRHRHRQLQSVEVGAVGWTWSLWGTQVLGMGLAQIDLILGGLFLPAQDLGLYAVLRRIANVVALPVSVATWISAKPIAAARGQNNIAAMQAASAHGSQIAWAPGLLLTLGCFVGLLCLTVAPQFVVTVEAAKVFAMLVLGALGQAFFASGLTVATLGNQARLSVIARGGSIAIFASVVFTWAGVISLLCFALAYVTAITLGSMLVWWGVWRRFGIDTSAWVLWGSEVPRWRIS